MVIILKGLPFIQSEGLKYADDNIPKDKFRLE